jgi:ferredoxin
MRIVIRKDLCCGAQLCMLAAPELMRLDALGYNDSDGLDVAGGLERQAEAAAQACPESAITLI